jgi:chromosomal replication initiation ATPase DnaA
MNQIEIASTVINMAAEEWAVKPSDITGKSHKGYIPIARHMSMFLIKKYTKYTNQQVTDIFNKSQISTIFYSRKSLIQAREAPAIDRSVKRVESAISALMSESEATKKWRISGLYIY